MDPLINWYQIRGLALLAILGVFLMYAILVGAWQDRRTKRITAQDLRRPPTANVANDVDVRRAKPKPSQQEMRAVFDSRGHPA